MKLYISELYYINTSEIPGEPSRVNISSHVKIYGLLTKLVRSRWLDIGQVLFFACLRTETESRSINSQEKINIQPSGPNKLGQKGVIIWLSGKFFLRNTAGNPERAR